jgi:hypothetical protein
MEKTNRLSTSKEEGKEQRKRDESESTKKFRKGNERKNKNVKKKRGKECKARDICFK